MIYEWKLDGDTRNFGDALHEVLLPSSTHKEWSEDKEKMYFVVGSVICNDIMRDTLEQGLQPIFVGCGWRGEELDPELVAKSVFKGCRGPRTQGELARHGVDVSVTLDPAYELPNLFPQGEANGMAITVRHIKDTTNFDKNAVHDLNADAMFSPVIHDKGDILAFIEKISGARFVLAGSMHAAIVAHAYGVPFALLRSNYIDCPPKWADWLESVDLGEPVWVDNVIQGREWYKTAVRVS